MNDIYMVLLKYKIKSIMDVKGVGVSTLSNQGISETQTQ